MGKKIIEYNVINMNHAAKDPLGSFCDEINVFIADGYQPLGAPFAGGDGDGTYHDVYQAMVKYEESN